MPTVEFATCLQGDLLVDPYLSIEQAQAWGRPDIERYNFHCFECGIALTPVVGQRGATLRHSASYRIKPLRPHAKWCPSSDESDVRHLKEESLTQQVAEGSIPAVFELPPVRTRQPAMIQMPRPEDLPRFEGHRQIRLRTRSLERLSEHYRALKKRGLDAPLQMAGCNGTTYVSIFKRMSDLSSDDLAQGDLQIYVGEISNIIQNNYGYRAKFRTHGRAGGSGFNASVYIPRSLLPDSHLRSVIATLETDGRKMLFAAGRFTETVAGEKVFQLRPQDAQLVYAALFRPTSNETQSQ